MTAESVDGTGPRTGRLVTRETNCPDGHRQRLCHPLGFRERNECELELRVLLGSLYLNNERQADHGYHPVKRRRPPSGAYRTAPDISPRT